MKRGWFGWQFIDFDQTSGESAGRCFFKCRITPAAKSVECSWIRDTQIIAHQNADACTVLNGIEQSRFNYVQTRQLHKRGENIYGLCPRDSP